MIIKSITLENFRQFKGECTLDFATDPQKNVTVIMGENGAGKTTLEQAFMWCLYDKNTFRVKELINREVRDGMTNGDEVKVSVTLMITHNQKNYKIVRKQRLKKQGSRLEKDQDGTLWVYEQDENGDYNPLHNTKGVAMIREFLPDELADFFFFDGERLEHMSEELLNRGKSSNFKGAVRGLVGLTAMMNAIEHLGRENLKRSVIGMINSEIDSQGDVSEAELSEQIEKLQTECDNQKNRLEEITPEHDRYQQDIGRFGKELQDMQNSINHQRDYEKYKMKKEREEAAQETARKSVYDYFGKNVGMYLLIPLLRRALSELGDANKLDKGIPHIHADTIKFLLNRGRCICGTDLKEHPEAVQHLNELISSLPPYSIGNMIGRYTDHAKIQTREADSFAKGFQEHMTNYAQHLTNIEEAEDHMHDLEKLLPDQEKVKRINQRIADARANAKRLNDERYRLTGSIQGKEAQIRRLEAERLHHRQASARNRKQLRYLAYAQAIKDQLEASYKKKEEQARADLEKCINQIFEDIYDGGIQISVSDSYNVETTVVDTDAASGDAIEKNTAQSYAIIFAFIAGIIKMAKESREVTGEKTYREDEGFPLVMDAPLSAFDKDRIKKICTVLPHIADQVIIFIKDTDGEIAEKYMQNIIGKKWLLKQETKTRSSVMERACV
ncbi:AAA family ATPase [uncultured Mitsuokella sp.]|uniref:AAA family ATPase n=1 Tax=Mitsuokella sp. TaxID=2049034 RepID=UPI00266F4246|nr:AAA family ATPase [uncultured Mitsuokella sp.]